jgi:flavorubredoxin
MDKAVPLSGDVFWIGVNDRETHLFEALWPLPYGVSYNSYIILDRKVAILDTVKFTTTGQFMDKVRTLLCGRDVDYLVINHMEPDHSGSVRTLMEAYPGMTLVGNEKTARFLENFYGIRERIKVVKDGETLDLGRHRLQFHITPMVHWPETMMTYDTTDRILFSADAFGGFGTLDGGIFDDQINVKFYVDEISRYFTNIVAKFSPMVQSALRKLSGLDVRIVASTHGPVWRTNPEFIINYYDRLSRQETEEGVVIVYGSMYGNTKHMAEEIASGVVEGGVKNIRIYDASKTHLSYLINDVWRYKGIVIGSCTYNAGMFPPISQLVHFMERSRTSGRVIGVFGSYSWSGEAVKELEAFARNGNCTFVEPAIKALACPKEDDLAALHDLGARIAKEVVAAKK